MDPLTQAIVYSYEDRPIRFLSEMRGIGRGFVRNKDTEETYVMIITKNNYFFKKCTLSYFNIELGEVMRVTICPSESNFDNRWSGRY